METVMSDEVTVQILVEIRDEIRSTNQQVNELRSEVRTGLGAVRSELQAGLGAVRSELQTGLAAVRSELLDSEVRMASRVNEQTAATRDLYDMLRGQFDLRDRVERCERDIDELKTRVG
jgi:chromosome segregation ATPase